jgi:nitrilase
MGKIAAGPLRRERGILYADCDLARVQQARRTLDVAGHYARPDVFDLEVRTFEGK